MMNDVEITITSPNVKKVSVSPDGYRRIVRESRVLDILQQSPYVPNIISKQEVDGGVALEIEYIEGKNGKEWLDLGDDWSANAQPWGMVACPLGSYVDAETDLLDRGIMYRDLNLEHLIFNDSGARLIDLEAAVIKNPGELTWLQDDMRGTWETMAPEEFPVRAELTTRTATYRVAVIAHLALSGRLPFERLPLRSEMHAWRKRYPAAISKDLPIATRHVFTSALARKAIHRHVDPQSFLAALARSYENPTKV